MGHCNNCPSQDLSASTFQDTGRSFWYVILRLSLLAAVVSIIMNVVSLRFGFALSRILGGGLLLALLARVPWRVITRTAYPMSPFSNKLFLNILIGCVGGTISVAIVHLIVPQSGRAFIEFFDRVPFLLLPAFLVVGLVRLNGVALVFIAVSEELMTRGIILPKAVAYFGNSVLGVLFSCLFFFLLHLENFLLDGLQDGEVRLMALFLVLQILQTTIVLYRKSLVLSIAWHYTYNAFLFGIHGFPSG